MPIVSAAVANGGSGASFSWLRVVTMPSRKAIDEIWPSPTDRRLISTRMEPLGMPD